MTALDQAFIKAFSQQGASPVLKPPSAAAPTVAAPAEPRPSPVVPAPMATKTETPSLPISAVFREVLSSLEKAPATAVTLPSLNPPNAPRTESLRREADSRPQPTPVAGAWSDSYDSWQSCLTMPTSVCIAESVYTAEPIQPPVLAETSFPAAVSVPFPFPQSNDFPQSDDMSGEAAATLAPPSDLATVSRPAAGKSAIETAAASPSRAESPVSLCAPADEPRTFKPAWQVDRFTWPRICRRLMDKANEEFDRLASALTAAKAQGQTIFALTASHRGEGTTTLLLCAARRLAEHGVRVALLDADLARPRIAKRLGVQPQVGWNETSERSATSLDHAVVEAASNGLAVVTVRDPASPRGQTSGDWSRLAPSIETLREHYDMVLVDLGPLENIESLGDALGKTLGGAIDALLLVHDGRITSSERLAEVEQELVEAKIPLAGVVQNFVAL
jgi:Mrp family chromosome partitioning ATPase